MTARSRRLTGLVSFRYGARRRDAVSAGEIRAHPRRHSGDGWGVFPEHDEDKGDWKIADSAIAQLKQARGPVVLRGGRLPLPHVPCFASQKWFDLYPEQSLLLPEVKVR